MLPLEKQVCSLELSKKLKTLRVKQKSLWIWTFRKEKDQPNLCLKIDIDVSRVERWCSAFTVAELGEMLGDRYLTKSHKTVRGNTVWDVYSIYEEDSINGEMISAKALYSDTEADARAKMRIYLLENKLI